MNTTNTNTHESENITMSTTQSMTVSFDVDAFADAVAAKVAAILNADSAVPAAPKGKAKVDKPIPPKDVDVDDTDTDDTDDNPERRAELTALRITSLRKIAREAGFDPDEIADADKETLIDSILDDEASGSDESDDDSEVEDEEVPDDDTDTDDDDDDEDDEDEDETEDDDSDESEFTRDDLEAMSLAELKSLGKESGYTVAEMKGKDQDTLIDMFLGSDDDEDEDEDDSDDEAEEEEEVTKDDLKAMSIPDLLALAKDWGVKVPVADRKSKVKIVNTMWAAV